MTIVFVSFRTGVNVYVRDMQMSLTYSSAMKVIGDRAGGSGLYQELVRAELALASAPADRVEAAQADFDAVRAEMKKAFMMGEDWRLFDAMIEFRVMSRAYACGDLQTMEVCLNRITDLLLYGADPLAAAA